MAKKLKNVRPGILMIPEAGIRLSPGAVVEVTEITREIEAAIKRGFLVNVDSVKEEAPLPDNQEEDEPESDEDVDITRLSASEAISRVGEEEDVDKLKAVLATEKRRTVIDALKRRLAEVEGAPE